MEISQDIEQYPEIPQFKGNDGKFYRAVSAIKIPYRPGEHTYQLRVEREENPAEGGQEDEWWLYVFNNYRKACLPLCRISGEQRISHRFPLTNRKVTKWHFYIIKRSKNSQKAYVQSDFILDFSEHADKEGLFLLVTTEGNRRKLRIELHSGTETGNLFENPIEVAY